MSSQKHLNEQRGNMPSFGKTSTERLLHCHSYLQLLFEEVVKDFDCSILVGYRGKEEQEKMVTQKRSKLHWPDSRHNRMPSMAVDVAPYPIDWEDTDRFYFFAGYVTATAKRLGLKIRWGGDWDQDYDLSDNKFNDLVHFELVD